MKKKKSYILISKKSGKFRLVDQQKNNTKTKNITIKDDRIDAINKLFLGEEITENLARERLKKIRDSIYRQRGELLPLGNTDNLTVLEKFWKHYRKKRRLKDPKSAYHKFARAIRCLEEINITTATEEQIQDKLDKNYSGANHQKIGGALRSILRFIDRGDVDLFLETNKKQEISYITREDLNLLCRNIEEENLRLLIQAAFYTGMRVGELMYLPSQLVEKDIVIVKKQIKRDGAIADTKTGIDRKTFILPGGEDIVKQWAACDKTLSVKRDNLAHKMRQLSKRYLNKSIKFHDLRHSYAICLVSQGVSLELVAKSMGNSVKVCEKYYSGYQLTDMGIETMRRLVK